MKKNLNFKFLKRNTLIEIQWHDFSSRHGWTSPTKELQDTMPVYCNSVGFFVGVNKAGELCMSDTKTNDPECYGGMRHFPVSQIQNSRKLKY